MRRVAVSLKKVNQENFLDTELGDSLPYFWPVGKSNYIHKLVM